MYYLNDRYRLSRPRAPRPPSPGSPRITQVLTAGIELGEPWASHSRGSKAFGRSGTRYFVATTGRRFATPSIIQMRIYRRSLDIPVVDLARPMRTSCRRREKALGASAMFKSRRLSVFSFILSVPLAFRGAVILLDQRHDDFPPALAPLRGRRPGLGLAGATASRSPYLAFVALRQLEGFFLRRRTEATRPPVRPVHGGHSYRFLRGRRSRQGTGLEPPGE